MSTIKQSISLRAGTTSQSADMTIRIAIALLITCAAALALLHAETYVAGAMLNNPTAAALHASACFETGC